MLAEAIDFLFGCKHKFAFPIHPNGQEKAYQVCICCGAEYEYDWNRMRRLGPRKQKPKAALTSELPKAA